MEVFLFSYALSRINSFLEHKQHIYLYDVCCNDCIENIHSNSDLCAVMAGTSLPEDLSVPQCSNYVIKSLMFDTNGSLSVCAYSVAAIILCFGVMKGRAAKLTRGIKDLHIEAATLELFFTAFCILVKAHEAFLRLIYCCQNEVALAMQKWVSTYFQKHSQNISIELYYHDLSKTLL